MQKKASLEKVKTLVIDSDKHIANIVLQSLRDLGFPNCRHLKSSADALTFLENQPVDLIITEWVLQPINGVDLVRQVRLSKASRNQGTPIIMLTGRGELSDIAAARDAGITEFLIKPFTVNTLFQRIEHVVEHPRGFVVSKEFVGPDRRRRPKPSDPPSERRINAPVIAQKQGKDLPAIGAGPMMTPPDFGLRRLLALSGPLSEVITPDVVEAAQTAINAMQDESMKWIREDLAALEQAFFETRKNDTALAFEQMEMATLSLKSRAGIFGYQVSSEIAQMLYAFLRQNYDAARPGHQQVIARFIEAMKVVFARNLKLKDEVISQWLDDLRQIMRRQG